MVGGLIGLFFSLPGIILGPFLGAGLFEMMGGRPWQEATRAGFGAVLGLLLGAVGKIACCIAMMLMFAVSVVLRTGVEAEPAAPAAAAAGLSFRAELAGPIVQGFALADIRDAGFAGDFQKAV